MFNIDRSYICHSFSIGWSPYFSRCNNTCWNWHFPILNGITRCLSHVTLRCLFLCPTLWKHSGSILPLIANFFGGLLTRVGVYFLFNKHSFKYCANTFSFMCGFKGKCLVISSSYHTNISFVIGPLSYNITYLSWLATSYNCALFMVLVWSYHWQSRCSFASMSMWERTYNSS